MKPINFSNINSLKTELENGFSVMYGAGGNGERILKIFNEYSIKIDYFCDDDYNKWDTLFCGIPVISFEGVQELSRNGNVNVILTSVFAGPILGKLEKFNITVYEPFSMLLDRYYSASFYKASLSAEKVSEFQRKVEVVADSMNDIESREILGKISEVVKAPDKMRYSHFFEVASREDCYFIKEVLEALPEHPVIVDCGGFTGDLMVALDRHGIIYDKVYSFEVNQELFDLMQENISRNSLEDKFIPINKGVWSVSGKAYLNVKPDDIAGGSIDDVNGLQIDTVTIDEYFKNISFDFIKMDIEGAELNAIRGGIGLIKRYRPIMAISLYHSIDDVVEIPLYLLGRGLDDYYYVIRHHSFIDSETLLYCIPCERLK